MNKLAIDPEFRSLIPPLRPEERELLATSLKAEGCRDVLVVWNGLLLDGHNRHEICTSEGIPFSTVDLVLKDRDAATTWIITNQLARRNLTAYQRAELALTLKPIVVAAAKDRQRLSKGRGKKGAQNSADLKRTRDELATKAGVSHDTIARTEFLQEHADDDTKAKLRTGETSINAAYSALAKPHVAHASGENEWYTPKEYIESAKAVMGEIDLDPASTKEANAVVGAKHFFTISDNGLDQDWQGRVWMNPPYAQPLIAQFVAKLDEYVASGDVTAAIVLVNNATETGWFQLLLGNAAAVCFPTGRVRFWAPGRDSATPLQGQALLGIGVNATVFCDRFSRHGPCMVQANDV